MIDFRLYRAAWLPAVAAFVAVMFSFVGIPEPIEAELSPTGFDTRRAAATLRQIVKQAPDRAPGSEGDRAIADLVGGRFGELRAGTVSEQVFEADYAGEEVEMRNVILTLPGESNRTIVVLAGRDSPSAPGAPSSAAATTVLVELATVFGNSDHTKTIVLVSTDGGSAGGVGAREFADVYPDRDLIDAVVAIEQPGFDRPHGPYVLTGSTDTASVSAQLARTMEAAVAEQAGVQVDRDGPFEQLARLAFPSGLGQAAVLIEDGVDAVGVSSAGERPLSASEGAADRLDEEVLLRFGSAALAGVQAMDQMIGSLEHGPETYVEFSGNLIPGWAIAALALALLLPPGIAAFDGLARTGRRRAGARRALLWAAGLAAPPLAGLVVLYLLALIGLVPRPVFPFDPGRLTMGFDELLALLLLVAITGFGYLRLGLVRPPRGVTAAALAPALGAMAAGAVLMVWFANPYLALLLVPAAHAWVVQGRERSGRSPLGVLAVAGALVLPLVAALDVAGALEVGTDAPWQLALLVVNGQIPPLAAVGSCALAGALLGMIAISLRRESGMDAERPMQRPRGARGEPSGSMGTS